MISSYIADMEFDGDIRANMEIVLIFEEDDVQVTVPGTAQTEESTPAEPEPDMDL